MRYGVLGIFGYLVTGINFWIFLLFSSISMRYLFTLLNLFSVWEMKIENARHFDKQTMWNIVRVLLKRERGQCEYYSDKPLCWYRGGGHCDDCGKYTRSKMWYWLHMFQYIMCRCNSKNIGFWEFRFNHLIMSKEYKGYLHVTQNRNSWDMMLWD